VTLTFDLLTLKVVSESRVSWATSAPILVFLGLSVVDLGPMSAAYFRRQTDVRQHHCLMPPPIRIGGITTERQNTQITQNNTTQKVAPFSSKTYTLKTI